MTRFLFDVNVVSNTHRAPMSISWVNHSQFILMSTAAMMAVTPLTKQIIKVRAYPISLQCVPKAIPGDVSCTSLSP
jgi:hypothetical protein